MIEYRGENIKTFLEFRAVLNTERKIEGMHPRPAEMFTSTLYRMLKSSNREPTEAATDYCEYVCRGGAEEPETAKLIFSGN